MARKKNPGPSSEELEARAFRAHRAALATAIRAVLPFASTDGTRPSLSSVSIGLWNNRTTAIATDGHGIAMVQAQTADGGKHHFTGGAEDHEAHRFGTARAIVLPAGPLAEALKGRNLSAVFDGSRGLAGALVVGRWEEGVFVETAHVDAETDAAFPNWRHACAASDPAAARSSMNPGYLERIGTFGRSIGLRGLMLTCAANGAMTATGETEEFRVCVWQMPLRLFVNENKGRDVMVSTLLDPGAHRSAAAAE